jgi:hypothetical protein
MFHLGGNSSSALAIYDGPVIRHGGLSASYIASILSLPIWGLFTIHQLTHPIRNASDLEFANFVNSVGEDISSLCVNLCPWLHHTTSFDEA